ncbi:MAG: hypothetical protein HYX75_00870 [Acidobacteria bacterium]|nr:hypothetical protein [Acidobacteriota bacterium]
MKCMCSFRTMYLAFLVSVCVGFPSVPLCSAVTPYPLKKVAPKGFQIFQGILAWAPVSSSKAVPFARDKAADGSGWIGFLGGRGQPRLSHTQPLSMGQLLQRILGTLTR